MIPQEGKVLVKFSAPWCGPCKMLAATMEDVNFGSTTLVDINIDDEMDLAKQYNVRGVPTLVLLQDGVEVARRSGMMMASAIEEFIK